MRVAVQHGLGMATNPWEIAEEDRHTRTDASIRSRWWVRWVHMYLVGMSQYVYLRDLVVGLAIHGVSPQVAANNPHNPPIVTLGLRGRIASVLGCES